MKCWLVVLAVPWSIADSLQGQNPAVVNGVEHVVIIGCDGLSPDGIVKAKTPHQDDLMKRGAFTLHARGVLPTDSSPNWASMITGVW